jgi:hypothetical protein
MDLIDLAVAFASAHGAALLVLAAFLFGLMLGRD